MLCREHNDFTVCSNPEILLWNFCRDLCYNYQRPLRLWQHNENRLSRLSKFYNGDEWIQHKNTGFVIENHPYRVSHPEPASLTPRRFVLADALGYRIANNFTKIHYCKGKPLCCCFHLERRRINRQERSGHYHIMNDIFVQVILKRDKSPLLMKMTLSAL